MLLMYDLCKYAEASNKVKNIINIFLYKFAFEFAFFVIINIVIFCIHAFSISKHLIYIYISILDILLLIAYVLNFIC